MEPKKAEGNKTKESAAREKETKDAEFLGFLDAKFEALKEDQRATQGVAKGDVRAVATPQAAAEARPVLHRAGSSFDGVASILNRQCSSSLESTPSTSALQLYTPASQNGALSDHSAKGILNGAKTEIAREEMAEVGPKKRRPRTEAEKALHAKKERFYRSLNSEGQWRAWVNITNHGKCV